MIRLLVGDALAQLRTLADESVHCVVTSPPYFGLRCYGVEGQYGLEATIEEHVARMVEVFREVRRVMRHDATLWLNYGDGYARGGDVPGPGVSAKVGNTKMGIQGGVRGVPLGLKPKDLVGMPWRVAFALQADGWWLRSDIIWHKPNPMPESVTDRPTKAHEYVFLLSKSARYFYDADAVRESEAREWTGERNGQRWTSGIAEGKVLGRATDPNCGLVGSGSVDGKRNLRSVWTIPTSPFPDAHFATFPPALVEPCIKAGTSEKGCCATCGAPWARVVERETRAGTGAYDAVNEAAVMATKVNGTSLRGNPGKNLGVLAKNQTGWRATCAHRGEPVPATVLDCFGGAGTTALVADRLGRNAILIELNPEYAAMAEKRIKEDCPMFAEVTRSVIA